VVYYCSAVYSANAPWLASYTEALRGHEVIIIPDADEPGRKRGRRIAHALFGKVRRLIWWELEGAKDIAEWFAQGHSETELIECTSVTEEAHA